jgi:hypothetical protein
MAIREEVLQELTRLGDKHTAAKMLDCGAATLKNWRLDPASGLIEGVHWFRPNRRVVRYRLGLLKHWFEHRHEPEMHRRLIQEYQVHEALRVGQRAESIRRPSSVHELVPATPSRRGARGSGAPVQ